MTSIREAIRRFLTPAQPLPAGVFHFQASPDDPRNYRLHLRLEPDGSGLLIVNAHTILHLNQTAAEYAYHLIKGTAKDEVAGQVASRYKVNKGQALADFTDFSQKLDTLVTIPDMDPEMFLGFTRAVPNEQTLSAPIRLDCALTYRLPAGADPALAPTQRVKQELTTGEWETILEKAWQAGIPHVIFTGGEPTLREDLIDLVMQAELIGQVSGLLTDGLKLAEDEYRQALLKTGLDHILFILQPENEASWSALTSLMPEDIFVAVHLTITDQNSSRINGWIERLARTGVKALSLSALNHDLDQDLLAARQKASEVELTMVWDLPVPYSAMNPVALELESENFHQGAGSRWMYVEPDGDVMDAQGKPEVRGNLLTDDWQKIWQNRS